MYSGEHSVTFTDSENVSKNTWSDWYLIPSKPPVLNPPGKNFKYVDIPGRSGSLDITDYLTTTPTETDRSGSWEFYVENGHGNWFDREGTIGSFLNGREFTITFADDPSHYYTGRCVMSKNDPGDSFSSIVIDYRVKPAVYTLSSSST